MNIYSRVTRKQSESPALFWLAKITGNKARDRRVNRTLRTKGWKVIRVWEHELRRRDEAKLIRRLSNLCPRRP